MERRKGTYILAFVEFNISLMYATFLQWLNVDGFIETLNNIKPTDHSSVS